MNPSNVSVRAPRRPGFWAEHALSIVVICVTTIGLAVGWELFADRLLDRSSRASAASADEARLWGGPLLQPHPEVRWRRADAATAELSSGELAQSRVNVDLDTAYRRRGLVEFPCYEAQFAGSYDFKNPSTEPAFVAFTVGLPVKGDALMLRDLKLLVDGHEDAAHTEYTPDRIVWTGQLKGASTAQFQLAYRARGLERFGYSLAGAHACAGAGCATTIKPVTGFLLTMNVKGARGQLDRLPGWMAPTGENGGLENTQLVWNVDRLLTAMDLGVVLPDNRGVSVALAKLMGNAPFFYMLFAGALLYALAAVPRRARVVHVLGLSGGYFLYFPLATYLTAYVPWAVACAIAFGGISVLAVLHAWQFIDRRRAQQVALCQLFFLGAPAGAYLFPSHTGLILVVAGFVILGLGLQAVGAVARRLGDDEPPVGPVVLPATPMPSSPGGAS